MPRLVPAAAVLAAGLLLGACAEQRDEPAARDSRSAGSPASTPAEQAATSPTSSPTSSPSGPSGDRTTQEPSRSDASSGPTGPQVSDGRPREALLSIPAIGVRDLRVVPYRGFTDDAPGTRIQDGGVAASPHGARGGVGPGGIGNYQVTAHRLSSTQAFLDLPALREGGRVVVTTDDRRYVYRVVDTRRTSFRSPASLRAQRAAVPGRPGLEPTRAMITLSTCATPEDRAAGNYWSDEFGNPEHRIDKIGVLVDSTPR